MLGGKKIFSFHISNNLNYFISFTWKNFLFKFSKWVILKIDLFFFKFNTERDDHFALIFIHKFSEMLYSSPSVTNSLFWYAIWDIILILFKLMYYLNQFFRFTDILHGFFYYIFWVINSYFIWWFDISNIPIKIKG